ncbi:B12-binding domain-containing radical SAM protein [bacterium]
MKIAIVSIQKNRKCTLKDMAGGFGTTFDIGNSAGAGFLEMLKKYIANVPDISMAYVAAVLRRAGHDVRFFFNDFASGYDIYLIQSSIVECANEKAAGVAIKNKGYGKVGFWGRFASEVPEYFSNACHFILRGEAEVLDTDRLSDPELKGIIDTGTVEDPDLLPFPDWDGFPLHKYRYRIIGSGGTILPILSSRGCPFNCHYCPYKVNNPFRAREPSRVVEEIEYLNDKYQARGIVFRDPDFTFSRERLHELLTLIIQKKLNHLSYYIEGRTDNVDAEDVRLMSGAGIAGWEIGIETPAYGTLRAHGRKAPDISHQEKVIHLCQKSGIRIVGNYMIGFPEDTESSILSVIDLARRLNTFAVQFTVCTPYPGTKFFDDVKEGIFEKRWENFTGWSNVFKHPSLAPGQIAALRERAYLAYHFRPAYIFSFLKTILVGWFRRLY